VGQSSIQIARDEGIIEIRHRSDGNGFDIALVPNRPELYLPRKRCQTTLPLEVIQCWIDQVRFAWVCDAISRHEDTSYVEAVLRRQLFAYFAVEQFAGKRLLDFGCGTGASTVVMSKMLPKTEIVGLELAPWRVELASRIKTFRGLQNVSFQCSPSGDKLPGSIGDFDFVMLSAVYEHLLPHERETVMPLLWSVLVPGGVVLINQTPYRYAPYEAHSTGLWFINYIPNRLAHWSVRHFAGRNPDINRSPDWNVHLRGGLRGATEKEIIRNLTSGDIRSARVLQPRQNGLRDRADFWLSGTNQQRYRTLKKYLAGLFRITDRIWGTVPSLNLDVVIQKVSNRAPMRNPA
jgi:2-polyprenyl-3-methyl-5-hydroxy-6-metoxy-1,4-benzoquinol methylase